MSTVAAIIFATTACNCDSGPSVTTDALVITSPADLRTTEVGGQVTLMLALAARPSSDVVVPVASSDATEGSVTTSSLTFTRDNWNAPQAVVVTGEDDDLADGNQPYEITFGPAVSEDDDFAGRTATSPALSNVDDETPSVLTSLASGATREDGGQATFTVVLASQPTADVVLSLASDDTTEGTITQTSLTFTALDWNAPQTVTVTGVNDDLLDGPVTYGVVITAITTADSRYASLDLPPSVALTNIDDDTAGFTVSAASAATTEGGDQATFTVRLNAQPSADVTVNFASSDTTEGTLTQSSLTFTAVNWNAPQMVTVTGVDDELADGNQPYEVAFTATTSADADYAAISPTNVELVNADDDSAGIVVSAISDDTDEDGAQASFTIVLTSEPTADVTVNFASDDTGEGTLTVSSVTFTPTNWNAPQTVIVTGANDDVADGDQPYQVDFSATTSADAAYAAIIPVNIDVVNTDDDTAGITVGAISGDTDEDGAQATFTIVLTSEPTADVTVNFGSDDMGEGTLAVSSVTFTPVNWNAPQTVIVTGANDDVADGDQPYQIDFAATTSADAAYAAITPINIDVVNTDDDSAGITVSAISGDTDEDGAQATFSVVLNSEPTADVTVSFDSDDATEGTLTVASLTFTSLNWNAPQTVVVTGVNDDVADGDQPYQIDFTATTSADTAYAAITPVNVDVVNTDDDTAGITVSVISGDTTEAGGTATFSVVLNSEPTATVTVNFGSDDAGEGTLVVSSLAFTAMNWNAPQTVTVTGENDAIDDGNQPYQIDFTATTSADGAYAAITPASVDVTNIDDDTAGITVSLISGNTTEVGGAATFTIVLNSEPTANVTVNFASDDTTEGNTNVTSRTFTTANWNVAQSVTVTGANDAIDDGNQPYQIDFAATTGGDPLYAGITPASVNVTNTDDDTAGIAVGFISGPTTEAGGTATFTIVLNSQPTASVTVNFASDDPTEGTTNVASRTFTTANWNVAQAVTVTGVNDVIDDGNQPYQIDFAATTGGDPIYAAITPSSVNVTNTDDDTSGIAVSLISGNTTEAGGTASFTIVLNTQPMANVTVNFASNDATEGVTNVASRTFTPANWNVAQSVIVTGQDDVAVDGNIAYQVVFTATTSADGLYAAITPAPVSVTNMDNDVPPCGNPSGGGVTHDNGVGTGVLYCYNAGDSVDTRARKACESHFGVGNCCVITGGYNSLQWGQCGGGGGGGSIHFHPDSHPNGHCGPFYVPGDVVAPGWCGVVTGNFLN